MLVRSNSGRHSESLVFLFGSAETPGLAAQGATHLPREGARGACMNSHAVGPRSIWAAGLTRGSSTRSFSNSFVLVLPFS